MGPFYFMELDQDLSSNTSSNASACPEGNQFIWNVFEQCITSPLEWASFGIGLFSIAFWLGVLMPQIVENFKDMRSVASISAGLLFSWIFGDTTNLVGAFLTKQGLFQVLLGVWFVITDLIISSQLIYYHCVFKRREKRTAAQGAGSKQLVLCIMGTMCMTAMFSGLQNPMVPDYGPRGGSGRRLLSTDLEDIKPFFKSNQEILGYILGIISTIAYFASRSFQIYKNFKYRNVKGLCTVTFLMAVLGNLLYGLAIVLYSVKVHYTLMHLPWLLGSWGIMSMDCFIVYQIKKYGKEDQGLTIVVKEPSEEDAPLLSSVSIQAEVYGTV